MDDDGLTNECWGYDAEEGEWTFVVEMGDAKAQHAGTAFPDGTFLVRGENCAGKSLATCHDNYIFVSGQRGTGFPWLFGENIFRPNEFLMLLLYCC